jgi:hypothetical protein
MEPVRQRWAGAKKEIPVRPTSVTWTIRKGGKHNFEREGGGAGMEDTSLELENQVRARCGGWGCGCGPYPTPCH